jgi:hypothetical protein
MSEEKYPNISAVFGAVDGLLGCVFGLIKLAAWLFLILLVVSFFGGLRS